MLDLPAQSPSTDLNQRRAPLGKGPADSTNANGASSGDCKELGLVSFIHDLGFTLQLHLGCCGGCLGFVLIWKHSGPSKQRWLVEEAPEDGREGSSGDPEAWERSTGLEELDWSLSSSKRVSGVGWDGAGGSCNTQASTC